MMQSWHHQRQSLQEQFDRAAEQAAALQPICSVCCEVQLGGFKCEELFGNEMLNQSGSRFQMSIWWALAVSEFGGEAPKWPRG